MAENFKWFMIAFLVFEFVLSQTLSYLNLKTWASPLPELVKNLFDSEKYSKAKDYAAANFNLETVIAGVSLVAVIFMLGLEGFASLDHFARGLTQNSILQTLTFFGILGLASNLISLPFSIYSTFVVEQKFGFNKMTVGLFISDKIKALLLSVILGGGLLALLGYLFILLGANFWWVGWVIVSSVSILIAMFFTSVFLPLFNKLSPLESGDLRAAIEKYAATVKFPLTNIYVMDGSKRSTKANAFFSGIGYKKNIVLFDNLIKDLSTEEVTAVLAHEVGHYQMKHVFKGIIVSVLQTGVLFYLFGFLARAPQVAKLLGAEENSFHLSVIAFMFLYMPVSLITRVLMNMLSRKHEYEADAYAAKTFNGAPLIEGLKKLSINHLSNLQPHPAYVFFNYSHPPLLARMSALTK